MSPRDHVLAAATVLAVVLLLAGTVQRVMRFAVPDGGIGMSLLVRR